MTIPIQKEFHPYKGYGPLPGARLPEPGTYFPCTSLYMVSLTLLHWFLFDQPISFLKTWSTRGHDDTAPTSTTTELTPTLKIVIIS